MFRRRKMLENWMIVLIKIKHQIWLHPLHLLRQANF